MPLKTATQIKTKFNIRDEISELLDDAVITAKEKIERCLGAAIDNTTVASNIIQGHAYLTYYLALDDYFTDVIREQDEIGGFGKTTSGVINEYRKYTEKDTQAARLYAKAKEWLAPDCVLAELVTTADGSTPLMTAASYTPTKTTTDCGGCFNASNV